MDFDFSLVMSSLPLLLQGALVTLKITALSVGLGLIFGLLAGVASLTPYWWVRIPARCYVDFIRGTPLLIQIFLIYFALPVTLNTRVDPFVAAVAPALSIPVPMWRKSSVPVFSPWTAVRLKLVARSVSPGSRPCARSLFRRLSSGSFPRLATNSLPC